MEHIVEDKGQLTEEIKPQKPKENLVILSKEERERNILNKFKSSITKSLENLDIKNLIDIKENNDNNSILDDDNVSVSSSKYFQSLQKQKNLNIKLPYIIGTIDYFKNEYLGVATSQSILGNMLGNTTLSNMNSNNVYIGENNSNNNQHQQTNFGKNSNNQGNASNANMDKLSMNMNLIEQIYERKNLYKNTAAADDDHLNDLLFKNRKNDLNNKNNNDFFDDANKQIHDQFRNIYSSNNKKNQNAIQDTNFVDFTRMNNNFNNNSIAFTNNYNNNNLPNNKENSKFIEEDKENFFALPVTGEPLIPTKIEVLLGKDNKTNTSNNLLIPNRRVTLDNFVKRTNLFDGNVIDNEEDEDNTGLFNKNNDGKFNLLFKNTPNNLFANQDNKNNEKIIEENNKEEKEPEKNEFKFFESQREEIVKSTFIGTDQKLGGSILKDLNQENNKNSFEDIGNNNNNNVPHQAMINDHNNEKQRSDEKAYAEKIKNKTFTNNLFSESVLEEEEIFTAKKNKNENINMIHQKKVKKNFFLWGVK